jgi:hypothetical protein
MAKKGVFISFIAYEDASTTTGVWYSGHLQSRIGEEL